MRGHGKRGGKKRSILVSFVRFSHTIPCHEPMEWFFNQGEQEDERVVRERGLQNLNFRAIFFFSSFWKDSLSLFFDGHAFPKTVYNIFSYACAVVRANARPPLGFFELLLGLFLNKLVFLFVRTGAELEASPVDGATGEYENIDQRGVITTTCSCYFYPFLSSLQIFLEMHFFCVCVYVFDLDDWNIFFVNEKTPMVFSL